jgi:hypothetical protein
MIRTCHKKDPQMIYRSKAQHQGHEKKGVCFEVVCLTVRYIPQAASRAMDSDIYIR